MTGRKKERSEQMFRSLTKNCRLLGISKIPAPSSAPSFCFPQRLFRIFLLGIPALGILQFESFSFFILRYKFLILSYSTLFLVFFFFFFGSRNLSLAKCFVLSSPHLPIYFSPSSLPVTEIMEQPSTADLQNFSRHETLRLFLSTESTTKRAGKKWLNKRSTLSILPSSHIANIYSVPDHNAPYDSHKDGTSARYVPK